MPPIDITGQRFGRLVVTHYVGNFSGISKWECHCECGNNVNVFRPSLISGKTVSCGCYRRERVAESELNNLLGVRFGKWIVISRADVRVTKSGYKVTMWNCLCDCGTLKPVTAMSLVGGQSKSCGCDSSRKTRTINISNKRFGYLVPIRMVGKSTNRDSIWECQCDCGNTINVLARSLKSGRTMSCGCRGKESMVAVEVKRYFKDNYGARLEYKVIKNPETGRWLSYDIFLDGNFIEINGSQHYEYVPYFFKTKERFQRRLDADSLKKRFAEENGRYVEVDLRKIQTTQEAIQYIESIIAPN